MTAIMLDARQLATAQTIAREIGSAFGVARREWGDSKRAVAALLHVHEAIVRDFERGTHHNLKLGNAVRFLDLYGLTLVVQRKGDAR